jgi:hypothetical protein
MKYIYQKFTCGICKQMKKGKGYDPEPLQIRDKVCKKCYEDELQRIRVNIGLGKLGLLDELNQLI